jgi:hypothetical protein
MSKEQVEVLRNAREQMVASRREWANMLAGPFDRDKTALAKTGIIETQKVIDDAISDEQRDGKPYAVVT